jgi:hypothetical protein
MKNVYANVACGGMDVHYKFSFVTFRDSNGRVVRRERLDHPDSNILVDIRGQQLNHEEMIKLDLHITNKASTDYKGTLLSAANKRDALEEKSNEYYANTHIPIRPICLIQVERTGKEQRTGRFIHSEDQHEVIHHKTSRILREAGLRVDLAFMSRHLIDIVPNPWIAYEFARMILAALRKNNDEKLIAHNFVFIIEETKKHLLSERDRLAHHIFTKALEQDAIRFWIIGGEIGFKFPQKQTATSSPDPTAGLN